VSITFAIGVMPVSTQPAGSPVVATLPEWTWISASPGGDVLESNA